MTVEIQVPDLGESLNTATIAHWLKQPGDYVKLGDNILELETDKVSLEVTASTSGVLMHIEPEGKDVEVGQVIAAIDDNAVAPTVQPEIEPSKTTESTEQENRLSQPFSEVSSAPKKEPEVPSSNVAPEPSTSLSGGGEHRVPMSRLRRTIARNLKEAQNTAAILTTFNEIDMTAVKELRAVYRDAFSKKHEGARLGFMSFFAKAVIGALKEYPIINAQIDGDDVIYRDHVNLGIAVGTERGLVVPVLRRAEDMTFAELERRIADYGKRARDGKLTLDELGGGSFTVTNGGIFGSLLSTPIVNSGQSGVLGMHAIQDRPVARNGEIVIRPMMYVALSYDHRLIDGREAVSFLVRLKELIEDPRRLLLDV
ncbi:dihydrolipoyllysine-residue succinyltransferase [Saccharibacter sp. 17.LH.SD]|uniref:dihydrolipoyllysine-residue succinyltransferase n=1 Tax=Saccharibacter sp. 17.LH.SD TaxID=2689393 RepID=UPI00136AE9C8|nr:dihydrolipoyllysine-residue succinyltransferase [Saccharibacter sp. 17.LH.SD]MXV45137.1 dihydrolipoyllysine-residue succinyltransferase [Saccharibacter sp. 17.LH.SD]